MLLLYLEEVKIHSFVPPKDKVINVSGKRLTVVGRFFHGNNRHPSGCFYNAMDWKVR